MRPVIGITTYVEQARWGVWDTTAALLPYSYVRAVEAAGGRAVLLPPTDHGVDETIAFIDGLILAGGADLDPALYGADAHPETTLLRLDRDSGEAHILRAALDNRTPVLGICRGMQLLNVVSGGTLHQHLPDVVGNTGHRPEPGVFGEHGVRFEPGSLACRLLGDRSDVKSYHHQGIDQVAATLTATGWADDGTVEVLERVDSAYAIGVLWHPEEGEDAGLFRGLVEAAGSPAAAR
ncbi:MAG: gamma-glutamyl-gamma-aminobutyrate hydrolase family protein [Mycobacteriales bacterium]